MIKYLLCVIVRCNNLIMCNYRVAYLTVLCTCGSIVSAQLKIYLISFIIKYKLQMYRRTQIKSLILNICVCKVDIYISFRFRSKSYSNNEWASCIIYFSNPCKRHFIFVIKATKIWSFLTSTWTKPMLATLCRSTWKLYRLHMTI